MANITQIAQNEAVNAIDGQLCIAARAMLGWSQERLRLEAGIARRTISDFEKEQRRPHSRIIRDIVSKLYENGIVFVKAKNGKKGLIV